jgi:phospholipase/lecithinase/hemolysin
MTFIRNTTCTSFAVGNAFINNFDVSTGAGASPFSITHQLQEASAGGNYKSSDLLLVSGGGNDAKALVGAYLVPDSGAFAAMTGTLIPEEILGPLLATGPPGFAQAGLLYMEKLADKFYDSIKVSALNKGAKRVTVVNMLGITNTPRLQLILDLVATGSPAGVRDQFEALVTSWVETFNARLADKVAGNKHIVLVDLYTAFEDQIANPVKYGLTNVVTPACPVVGEDSAGLPTYNLETCTADALFLNPPTGETGDWWQTYFWADDIHPTPLGHTLQSQIVARSLDTAGWF